MTPVSDEWIVHRYDSVTSTMDQAALLARFGARERTAIVSAEQTAGRGRGGRAWHAPRGTALLCTLIVRPRLPPAQLSTLPLVAGVAVAEAIESITRNPARLKWPNDVWVGSDAAIAKVAGVLVTSRLRGGEVDFVTVGIGINVSTRPEDLPPGATSLQFATGLRVESSDLFDVLLQRFDCNYATYLQAEGKPSLDAWRARAALLGERVTVVDAGREFMGTFLDIDADGALLLELEEPGSAIRRIVAGDLARGPRAASPRH